MCTRRSWLSFMPSWHLNYEPRLDRRAGCKRSRLVWKHFLSQRSRILVARELPALPDNLCFVKVVGLRLSWRNLVSKRFPCGHKGSGQAPFYLSATKPPPVQGYCRWWMLLSSYQLDVTWSSRFSRFMLSIELFFWRIMIGPRVFCFMCRIASIPSFPLAEFLFAYLGLPPFFH